MQEAKAASSLNHPHIVTIHDIDETDGVHFIAMEYVSGKTLDQLIPRHGMRLNEALKMSVQMADALAGLTSQALSSARADLLTEPESGQLTTLRRIEQRNEVSSRWQEIRRG